MADGIYDLLVMLGLSGADTRELYSQGTRDNPDIRVWRDARSGVIFIDDHYVGEETYESGEYRGAAYYPGALDFERLTDCRRRASDYAHFYVGKDICDFGCGAGDFLRTVKDNCRSVSGVELQQDYVQSLSEAGIPCERDLAELPDDSLDAIFSFHALEHLPNPLEVLNLMRAKVRNGGLLVLEVPHAGDFLLRDDLGCRPFKDFTLWSQHLILHTRHSLTTLLRHCGFTDIRIEGIQRYPLSNHLSWLSRGKPGGHRSPLAAIDTEELRAAHANALRKIDATDTITALAVVTK